MLSFFPRGVLDEILNLIESVSEGFLSYSFKLGIHVHKDSYNVGLKMGILLFVLPCIFLSLFIFRLRHQPYALEALKRGYSQIF